MNQEDIQNGGGIKIHLYEDPVTLNIQAPNSPNAVPYEVPFIHSPSSTTTTLIISSNGCATLGQRKSTSSSISRLRSSKSTSALNNNSIKSSTDESNNQSTKTTPATTFLDENEIYQIERFYLAHKTFVYVSRCMANLYFTKTDLINEGRISSPRSHEWSLERTGVPLIIFDKGETRARSKRQLKICLAERGTGFNLWGDVIDNLTDYKAVHPCFHTLYLSCDHRQMAGLSFDSADAAADFLRNIESITCDPLNIALSAPKRLISKKEKSSSKAKGKRDQFKAPRKEEISAPCLFQHVINVDTKDFDRLFSISSLVPHHRVNPELRSLHSLNTSSSSSSSSSSSAPVPPFLSSPSPVASTTSNSSMTTTSSENSSNFSV